MRQKKLKYLVFLVCFIALNLPMKNVKAQVKHDIQYGFAINIPPNWSQKSYMDGTDKVYDFYSPDENAAVQLRAFESMPGLTLDLLVQVYEQNMLPAGTQKQGLQDHTSANGIPGKQGVYLMNYEGNEVGMSSFYTIQNGKGYVLTAIIPVNMMQQKEAEIKQITRSFSIDGFTPPSVHQDKKPKGLGGLTGGLDGKKNHHSSGQTNNASCPAEIKYQGQNYATVLIGKQCWMAENLNVGQMIDLLKSQSDNGIIEKHCPGNTPAGCQKYGGLYAWNELMAYSEKEGAQGICPTGWHVPSDMDWRVLEAYVDSEYKNAADQSWEKADAFRGKDAARKLKSRNGWQKNRFNGKTENCNGTDDYRFNALPAGRVNKNGIYQFEGLSAFFWTSTKNAAWGNLATNRSLVEYSDNPQRSYKADRNYKFSVRCLKDE